MNNKFKAGDKVVALKGSHTIKVGDILTVDDADYFWFQAVECPGFTLRADNYVLHKPTFKNMKFRVNSPEHSKEIQEALFEMGYKWADENTSPMYLQDNFLTSWEDGSLDTGIHAYNMNTGGECILQTTKSYKITPKTETITIDGKTYNKEAVLKGLAELEEVK